MDLGCQGMTDGQEEKISEEIEEPSEGMLV